MQMQEEFLRTIESILKENVNSHSQSHDISSVVTNIDHDKYEVQINGSNYWVKNGVAISLEIGDHVWVHIPNGNMNEMFIMAKK